MNRGEDWEELDVKGCAMPPLDSLEELGLSVTSCCCLKRAGINTIEELCQMTKDDLYKLRNCGRKSIKEICEKMEEAGLHFKSSEEIESEYTEKNHPRRDRCHLLREIRIKIAKENNIEFEPIECHRMEPCNGTCLMCDYEVAYLDKKLQEKQERGEKISLTGLMSGKDE